MAEKRYIAKVNVNLNSSTATLYLTDERNKSKIIREVSLEEKGRARIEEAVKNRKEPRYALFIDESTGYAKNYVVFLMRKKVFGILDRLFLKPDKIRISNIKIRRENGVPGYKIVTPIGEGFLYEQNKFK